MLALSGGAALTALGATGCSAGGGANAAPAAVTAFSPGRVFAAPADGALGADFDQNLDLIDFAQLRAVTATWLRAFYPVPADGGNLTDQPGIQRLLAAIASGYGTILTLKFPYNDTPLPAPGSPAMATALAGLDQVLAVAMNKVDVVTIGNEPFNETAQADRDSDSINVFYEALANHAIQYRQEHFGASCRTQIYMGALTKLYLSANRTPRTERWMAFVSENRSIAGTDIHPHLPDPAAGQAYLDYILPWLRADQKFLATEFSLVFLWKEHLTDPVSPEFAHQYGFEPGTPVWQVVADAIDQPFSQQEWTDFLDSCSWFQANRDFLTDQVERFRRTGKLAVATYSFTQGLPMVQNFGPDKTPWVFNTMFCPHTVQQNPDGLPGQDYTWSNEFRALQHYGTGSFAETIQLSGGKHGTTARGGSRRVHAARCPGLRGWNRGRCSPWRSCPGRDPSVLAVGGASGRFRPDGILPAAEIENRRGAGT